jgi:glycine dehydrogenase
LFPAEQAKGYKRIVDRIIRLLNVITGFDACSLQPNSWRTGRICGLLTIRNFHLANDEAQPQCDPDPDLLHTAPILLRPLWRDEVGCSKALDNGYIDVADFKAKAEQHSVNLAGTMITYPSTYGIFEEEIKLICDIVHQHGGQVLHGWGKHECTVRIDLTGGHWCRCLSPEFA